MYRDSIFNTPYNIGEFILLLLYGTILGFYQVNLQRLAVSHTDATCFAQAGGINKFIK
jgi:hypothetical protein